MGMAVFKGFVGVFVLVALGQVQPHPQCQHEQRGADSVTQKADHHRTQDHWPCRPCVSEGERYGDIHASRHQPAPFGLQRAEANAGLI